MSEQKAILFAAKHRCTDKYKVNYWSYGDCDDNDDDDDVSFDQQTYIYIYILLMKHYITSHNIYKSLIWGKISANIDMNAMHTVKDTAIK